MAFTYETTHEYYIKNPCMYYCEDHDTLIVSDDHTDRLVLGGIEKKTILEFCTKYYKESLKKQLKKDTKEVVTK